jgi:hypothetical protein
MDMGNVKRLDDDGFLTGRSGQYYVVVAFGSYTPV